MVFLIQIFVKRQARITNCLPKRVTDGGPEGCTHRGRVKALARRPGRRANNRMRRRPTHRLTRLTRHEIGLSTSLLPAARSESDTVARDGGAMRPTKPRSWFTRLTKWTAHAAGRPLTFMMAFAVIIVWGVTGPLFRFSDTWQLVINTGTTIVTFLMVFLIQSTQNRDGEAVQVKLDEIIRAIGKAQNELLDLEELEEEDLERIRDGYRQMARKARHEREA
jgi:low affinity Fe/Cu permease